MNVVNSMGCFCWYDKFVDVTVLVSVSQHKRGGVNLIMLREFDH